MMEALDTYAGRFSGVPEEIRRVRAEVREYLDGCPAADDAVLIADELAANAVLHSLSRDGTFTVCVERYDTYVYLEVEDAGGPWVPQPADDRPHGLDIVRCLTVRWGIGKRPAGRLVWARVDFQQGVMMRRGEPRPSVRGRKRCFHPSIGELT
jgi:anti-sigma regulatory factor (Ser/Thr protein kinase)